MRPSLRAPSAHARGRIVTSRTSTLRTLAHFAHFAHFRGRATQSSRIKGEARALQIAESLACQIGDAEVELRKANDYQKKSKTMLCIYLLLLLCGLMVIVLLLKKSLSSR